MESRTDLPHLGQKHHSGCRVVLHVGHSDMSLICSMFMHYTQAHQVMQDTSVSCRIRGDIRETWPMFTSFIIYLSELLQAVSERVRLNPLYAIPLIFLALVFLFALFLGVAIFVLPK